MFINANARELLLLYARVYSKKVRIMPMKLEFELSEPPTDGITRVTFCPVSNAPLLLCSSWDNHVRLYDVANNAMRADYTHSYAVLDCTFSDPNHSFSGSVDGVLKGYDFTARAETVLGTHEDGIRCVQYCQELGLVVTGSWDKTVKLWDPRQKHSVGTYDQNGESVYTMSLCGDRLVVGTSNRKILVWDLKNMQFAEQRRASSLKYQTRSIQCFPNKQGFVLSSIEGRVAVEFLDTDPETQKKKYAFKCHRLKEAGVEHIYPVNAISFHSSHGTFATGGSDGFVNIWDPFNKKRLCQFHRYPSDIASLAFNVDGTMIAIAVSNLWLQEGKEKAKDGIFIRHVTDQETQPK